MWMNLHTLPVGTSMYTAMLAWTDGGSEEIDFTGPASASRDKLVELATAEAGDDFTEGWVIAGIANQSDGYVVFDNTAELLGGE